jgi:hypothetical protein
LDWRPLLVVLCLTSNIKYKISLKANLLAE